MVKHLVKNGFEVNYTHPNLLYIFGLIEKYNRV